MPRPLEVVSAKDHDAAVYGTDRDSWSRGGDEAPTAAETSTLCLTIILFGATGDLARKKTFPSIASLYLRGFLPENMQIVGFGRSPVADDDLRKKIKEKLPGTEEEKAKFLKCVTYHEGGAYDKPEGFKSLQQTLAKIEGAANASAAGRLFYLAIPPTAYTSVLQNIKAECTELMMKGEKDKCESWLRIIVEKPFGRDLPTSEELSCEVAKLFSESEIYRIDHFLGKELSQNMLLMRFTNQFLASIWSNENIDNIQITMKEAFGTEGREGYFDNFGIIRDVVQNHLLQLLALLTMERPVLMHPDDIRDEKTKLFRSIRTVEDSDCVIAQYTAGNGKAGYKDNEKVPKDSNTPTYTVIRLWCDNERWQGVPMLIKTGKALNETKTEVRVQFKSKAGFFGRDADGYRNELVMQLAPKNVMYLKIVVKKPGLGMELGMSELNLSYHERYDTYIPEAYERLILDAIKGNQQHFVRRDELRASWAIFTPLLQRIDKGQGPKMHTYPYGARGLEAGDKLIKDSGYVRSSEYTWRLQGAPQGSGN